MIKKICRTCNEEKPVDMFFTTKKSDRKQPRYVTRADCKACTSIILKQKFEELSDDDKEKHRESKRKWHKENPEKSKYGRRRSQLQKYGLTIEEYKMMNESQNGLCQICNKPDITGKQLAVDHCHKTKKIRGLLCNRCNVSLGNFYDSEELLKNAIEYLRRNK